MSAGILPWRRSEAGLELFLARMGGPFWANREEGAWSIVKGELAASYSRIWWLGLEAAYPR